VTAVVAGLLAAVASASAVAVVARRSQAASFDRLPTGPRVDRRRSHLLVAVGSLPFVGRVRASQRTIGLLSRAGVDRTDRELVGMKVLAAAAATSIALAVAPPTAMLAGAAAFRIPDIAIARAAKRRSAAADREIPVLLDLLAVATSAGLPAQLAFRRAVEAAEGPLADDIRPVLNATDLGGRWRDELRTVSDRLDLPDLRRLVGTLARSETLGSPLSDELERLAGDVREARRARATERARAAPVKMLFPLVFLVLPAFLLLTVVPVLVTTVRSIA
jgi:Flp pilus assembly protein TadB